MKEQVEAGKIQSAIDRLPKFKSPGAYVKQLIRDKWVEHRQYVTTVGKDMPEVEDWKWGYYSNSAQENSPSAETHTQENPSNSPSQEGAEGTARSDS